MENPATTISQVQLVGSPNPGRKFPQYVAALSATLGALATGLMIGWSSPATDGLKGNAYDFDLTDQDIAWIGSISNLGAAFVCYPIGIIMNIIGRKYAMLVQVIPFVLGWLLVTLAENFAMIMAGRFIIGVAGGAFCVVAPCYTSEIAEVEVRGALGSLFQLMVTAGILLAYIIGSYVDLLVFNIICTVIPVIFGIIFFFMPETPYYLLYREKTDEAEKSMRWLRGSEYDIASELSVTKNKIETDRENPQSFIQGFKKRSAVLALIICMSLMLFQQFSGINAVLFNAKEIFESATDAIEPEISTIIIGALQVIATFVSTLTIDRLGRKILLLLSGIFMAICDVLLGVYFHLKYETDTDKDVIDSISWLPLTSLCVFIVTFSIGFGPIPWILAGELCTPNVKAFVSSTAGTFNWILAFIITRTFVDMKESLGQGGAFWLFAGFTVESVLFIIFVIPETKGKSFDEIQSILNREKSN